jgi:long-chain-fatty-acid--CoA ligase ACSBG
MLYGLADKLVFQTVKERLGLDRCVFFISGAAPITRDTLSFFGSLDIPILEVYGMSECTGPSTIGTPSAFRIGTVGPAIPGVELRIDHDPNRDKPGHGEICYRGRNIMMGYMKNPQKSAEAIDREGWLHSGDVGHIDEFGLLSITGRIKELIITAGGENIAPVPIEEGIKAELPGISNIMMVGDKRKYNVCLITLFSEMDPDTGRFTNKLSGASLGVNGSDAKTTQEARECPKWKEYLTAGITTCNGRAVSNAQKIQKFFILDEDFSDPSGDLTPTLKLKRSKVAEKYNAEIETLYA